MSSDVVTRPPESVTVTVTRRALPGRDEEMSAWVQAGQRLAGGFDGFLGAGHVRPGPASQDWHMLYRFADERALDRWQRSEQRDWWLKSALGIVQETRVEKRTGIEGWFDEPSGRVLSTAVPNGPPRWKQACVIFLAFAPVNLAAQAVLLPVVGGWPLPLRVLALTAVLIPLMTYLVLPFVTSRLQWWLEGRPGPWRRRRRHAGRP
ncbi:antibiotic biosynthesis monooxygenase [Aquipuribacter hungaricus]|uniref:Antibiotic biosynthesis monooxygenase n=1 Tax=Aquipuribacter hungaricus TaxID=545624 RepID=A0ABV7WCR7_9MICO